MRSPARKLAFAVAVAAVVSTFFLIVVGGVVHATGSGLACPDWPTCYGSFFPPMVGKVLFEHGHRLFATAVGCLTILLVILTWRAWPTGHPGRALSAASLGLVLWQGILGGMTVRMRLPDSVTSAHLAHAMAFLALLTWTAFRLKAAGSDRPLPRPLLWWIAGALALVYGQIVLGAVVRHTDSGLACTSIPLCGPSLWPAGADWRIQLHMAHRLLGVAASVAVIVVSFRALAGGGANRTARLFASVAPALVVVQLMLGVMSVMTALEVGVVTAHLAVGALLLADLTALLLAGAGVSEKVAAAVPAPPRRGGELTLGLGQGGEPA